MTEQEANTVTQLWGMKARSCKGGFFLKHKAGGDDKVFVGANGDITMYAHDAQAYIVAKALRDLMIVTAA